MTRIAAAVVIVLVLAQASFAADIKPVRIVTPNNMIVLIVDQPSLPIVTVNVLVKAGAVHDPDALAGLAYMTAGMLDEDLGLTILSDILMNPIFAEKDVARVRGELMGQLQGEKDEPGVIAIKAFDEIVFQGNPYRRAANGTEKTVPKITRNDLVQFHHTYYRPNRTIVAIVGDIREHEALDVVRKHFGKWTKKDGVPSTFSPAVPLQQPKLKLIDKDLTQANVILGHLGIDRKNPDFYAVSVMNYILGGGGFSSRLVNRIRDQKGLAYDVDSGFQANVMPGPFTVQLQTRNAAANQAIASVVEEMKRIRTEPVCDQELADAKAYLIGSFPLRLDTTGKLAALLTLVELHGLGLSYFEDYPKAIRAVTKEDVLRVAEKYLHADVYALVVVAKQSEAKINPEMVLGKP